MISFLRIERVIRMGFKNLGQYKMRASLTVLGIVFGVLSVVAMLSVGEGANQEIQEQIQRLGSNNILLKSVKLPDEAGGSGRGGLSMAVYGLLYDDLSKFAHLVNNLQSVTPVKIVRQQVQYRDRSLETDIAATMPWYPDVTNYRLLSGRFFTKQDATDNAAVCVIGGRLARTLFVAEDPVGKELHVGAELYRIVGVMGDVYSTNDYENKPLWFVGENQNVYLPLSSYRARRGDSFIKMSGGSLTAEKVEVHQAILTLKDQDAVMAGSDVVRRILADTHKRMDYEIVVPLQLIQQTQETRRLFNIVLGSIAAISLIVGGIGIMNIMLATVSERTREIGIRRALGAKRSDIVTQFLIETLILSITGGVIGLIGGVIVPLTISSITGVRTVLTPFSFIVAFGVSVAVGLIFGIYPARRAAMMDPIEALRHE